MNVNGFYPILFIHILFSLFDHKAIDIMQTYCNTTYNINWQWQEYKIEKKPATNEKNKDKLFRETIHTHAYTQATHIRREKDREREKVRESERE